MKMNDSTNKRMPRFVSAETAVFSNKGAIYDSPGHSSPNGAEEKSHTAKRAVLEKQVNANMEGMGYGG